MLGDRNGAAELIDLSFDNQVKNLIAKLFEDQEDTKLRSHNYPHAKLVTRFWSVLAPVGFEGTHFVKELWEADKLELEYREALGEIVSRKDWLILHGHDTEECCRAYHMCHVFGYTPDEEDPKFQRAFNKKWRENHEKEDHPRPSSSERPSLGLSNNFGSDVGFG